MTDSRKLEEYKTRNFSPHPTCTAALLLRFQCQPISSQVYDEYTVKTLSTGIFGVTKLVNFGVLLISCKLRRLCIW
jgi:hypothetical protein